MTAPMTSREALLELAGSLRSSADTDLIQELRMVMRRVATALDRLGVAQSPAWQPIETAPKDGTRLVVAWDDIASLPMHWEVSRYRSGTGPGSGWCNTYGHSFHGAPTHWMLPPKSSSVPSTHQGGK